MVPVEERRKTLRSAGKKLASFRGKESLHTSQVAHHAYVYLRFLRHEAIRSISTLSGWHARPLQGYPALHSPAFIYTPGHCQMALPELSVFLKNTIQCLQPKLKAGPLDPETSALTMEPPHFQRFTRYQAGYFVISLGCKTKSLEDLLISVVMN